MVIVENNVLQFMILIVVLVTVRFLVPLVLPVINGLVEPLCVIALVWGFWEYILRPLLGPRS